MQGLKRPELKDELFMQLLKQTRGNPNVSSRAKAWELFHLVAATMPPSKVAGNMRCGVGMCSMCALMSAFANSIEG